MQDRKNKPVFKSKKTNCWD